MDILKIGLNINNEAYLSDIEQIFGKKAWDSLGYRDHQSIQSSITTILRQSYREYKERLLSK